MAHCKKKKKKKKKTEIFTNRESNSDHSECRERSDRSIAPHGVGSRGPLKGPWWGPGAKPMVGVEGAK